MSYQVNWEIQALDQTAGFLRDDPIGVAALWDAVSRLADEPRPPVALAEDQVAVLPPLASPQPGGELGLAVLAQPPGRLGVEEDQLLARPGLRPALGQLLGKLEQRPVDSEHAPVQVGVGPPEPAQLAPRQPRKTAMRNISPIGPPAVATARWQAVC